MKKLTRRQVVCTTFGLLVLAGCDSNPNGPAFPQVPVAKEGGDPADDKAGGPAVKGRKKSNPVRTINDPAL